MSSHNYRSRRNRNTRTVNDVHDLDRAGVPDNIPMLEHIGDPSSDESRSVDSDVGYTELQRDIIDESEQKLYDRVQHDISHDDPRRLAPTNSAHMLGGHGDRGYDYRNFPKNIAQDHENFDPHTQYLHSRGLIGLNKSRYITNYVNIDSRDRNLLPCTKDSSPIELVTDPLSFNSDILRICLDDVPRTVVDKLTPGTKITIKGLEEYSFTLRTAVPNNFGDLVESFVFMEGEQYMRVEASNNIDVQTGDIVDVKEDYADNKVRFDGFKGDVMKQYTFNFNGFIVNMTSNPDGTTTFEIREDLYGDMLMKIADFVVDAFGVVIEDNTERPYTDVISWTYPGLPPPNDVMLVPGYFASAANELNDVPAPSIPISFVEYIRYIERMQNAIRPVLDAFVGDPNSAFTQLHIDNNDTYETEVRFVLDEFTQCVNTSRYGNIPLNFLNMTHNIFFTDTDVQACIDGEPPTTDIPSASNFFIKLDRPYQQTVATYVQPMSSSSLVVTVYERRLCDVLVAFKHYGGIPIRSINAEFPLGPLSDAGFRFVIDTREIGGKLFALVQLDRAGYLNRNFGGDCLTFSFVESEDSGSVQSNSYIVEFGRVYYRVAVIRMVSSQFPIAHKAFTDGITGGLRNNTLCWQNLDDGSIVYSVEVEPGNYSPEELKLELETKVSQVMRFDEEIPRNIPNVMTFDIDDNTDLVRIEAFDVYRSVTEPYVVAVNFIDINTFGSPENLDPENAYYVFPSQFYTDFPGFNQSCNCFRIKINHPNHGLSRFDEIVIRGSINLGTIGAADLNGRHVVTNVVDANYYDIVIENINAIVPDDPTAFGGFDVEILIPTRFRLLFNKPGTMGVQLGFRSVGLETSITPYETVITNDVLYEDETIEDVLSLINPNIDVSAIDTSNVAIRNAVNLAGPQYLLITCPEVENIRGRGRVKDIFYKINLNDNSKNSGDTVEPMAYDSFADTPVYYNEPLRRLEKLTLEFLTPDGDLYDFNGQDHSFVLEIVTYEEIPESTSLQKK